MNWMFAAILICGASVVVTSCGDDDDDNKGSQTTPNTYEVTITAILQECTAKLFDLNVEYTDADGKKNTVVVKGGDQTEVISAEAKNLYDEQKNFCIGVALQQYTEEEKAEFEKYIVKNIKITVPEGKSCSFAGTVKAKNDYTVTSPYANFITPLVFSTCKYVSGSSPDRAHSGYSGSMTIKAYMGVDTSHLDEVFEILDGSSAGKATLTM